MRIELEKEKVLNESLVKHINVSFQQNENKVAIRKMKWKLIWKRTERIMVQSATQACEIMLIGSMKACRKMN